MKSALTLSLLIASLMSTNAALACMQAPFDVELGGATVATLQGNRLLSDEWEESTSPHQSDRDGYEMTVYFNLTHTLSLRLYESTEVQPGTIWDLYTLASGGKNLVRSYEIKRVRSMGRTARLTPIDGDESRLSVGCH